MTTISILFSGRGTNANSIIDYVLSNKLNLKIKIIVCNNKNAIGIKMLNDYNFQKKILDMSSYADKNKYNIELHNILNPKKNEYLILCGYMSKIPNHLIQAYNGNIINIHPSLLPKYKGLNTHEKVINNGDEIHGCSTHFVTCNIDEGPIIAQYRLPVNKNDTALSISKKLLPLEHKLYYETLKMIEEKRIYLRDNKVIFDGKFLNEPIIFN